VGPVQHECRRLATCEDRGNDRPAESARTYAKLLRALWYGPALVIAPPWRLLGIAAAGTAGLVLPLAPAAAPPSKLQQLRSDAAAIESQKRSAILSLYSLDSRLVAAHDRLASLRSQRAQLTAELHVAEVDARISQRELAARVRSLYDHGSTSTLEVIFGANSLNEAMTELDNLHRVTTIDDEILHQVRSARRHELLTKARLQSALEQAGAEARSLATVRSQRAAYVARLASRQALDAREIARLEAQAQAAEAKAQQLIRKAPAATVGVPVEIRSTQALGRTVTVVSTGYCLTGRTATGIPVGWGVAAVDPGVIPLGTQLTIPGYGEAVAADTGGSIVGGRIDLWFPTCAQAGGWGSRSVTIALH
jgi:peptidoglycan DL-endopeptidase CwlO